MATKALNYTTAEINQRLNLAGTAVQPNALNDYYSKTEVDGKVVVDLSIRYNTSYANLSAALAALNSDTATDATAIKKGGVSIKFINSSTNKYEQWNLKASSWSTNISDWALDVDGSVTNDKLKLPFELEKPSSNEYVTQASAIGHNGQSLDKTLEGLDNISKESTQSEEDAIIYETNGGTQVGKIDANGADFTNLKISGQQVAIMSDLPTVPTLDTSISSNPSNSHTPSTKAVKDYVDAHGGVGNLPIDEETTQDENEALKVTNNDGSDTYAQVDSSGIHAKGYYDMEGNPIGGGVGNLPISDEETETREEEMLLINEATDEVYAAFGNYGIKTKQILDMSGKVLSLPKNVLFVGADCQYKTIQAAVDVAVDDDVIFIMSGTYEETINVSGFTIIDNGSSYVWEWYTYASNPHPPKRLHFVGADREECIIVNYTGDYRTPPFHMMQGSLQNLTIMAVHKDGKDYSGIRKSNYCLHYDGNNYEYYRNKKMLIQNCRMIADSQDVIGAGAMRKGGKITVKDCYLEQTGSYRCFGIHNNPIQSDGDFTFDVELLNNVMKANNSRCVGLTSYDLANYCSMKLLACNNSMYSTSRGRDAFTITDPAEVISLSEINFGNSAPTMNNNV